MKVFDKDAENLEDLSFHKLCGSIEFTMAGLMTSRLGVIDTPLTGGYNTAGRIIVRSEVVANTRDIFVGNFSASKLVNKDGWFGKSDPYLVVSRIQEDGSWLRVFETSRIDNNLSPTWPEFRIAMSVLCNGDLDRPLRWEIFDWSSDGKHQYMGAVQASVRTLQANAGPYDVIEEAKKKSDSRYGNSGTLTARVNVEHHPCFTDFIKGGCELNLMVAIDYTASNGDPSSPSSLHYIDRSGASLNSYQRAIRAVGSIVEAYDTDKKFPTLGFGGRVNEAVSHAFNVGAEENDGVTGVEAAYMASLSTVALSGPTLLAPILQNVRARLLANPITQERQKYTVLLVICDGTLNDMQATIHELVELSGLPLSVILIGVGGADFGDMNALDADGKRLTSQGRVACRDLVQFVPMRDFESKGPFAFSEAVLAELPTQFLQFMEGVHIVPNSPPPPYIAP